MTALESQHAIHVYSSIKSTFHSFIVGANKFVNLGQYISCEITLKGGMRPYFDVNSLIYCICRLLFEFYDIERVGAQNVKLFNPAETRMPSHRLILIPIQIILWRCRWPEYTVLYRRVGRHYIIIFPYPYTI
jgi:hypothetical protein